MIRKQEFYHLLDQEFMNVNEVREATLGDVLQGQLDIAQGELDGLMELFNTAQGAKDDFDAEETRLRAARADLDNADPAASQDDIDAAD